MPEELSDCCEFIVGQWHFSIKSESLAWAGCPIYDIARDLFEKALENITLSINPKSEIFVDILLGDDCFIQNLNKVYRNKDVPTNVLSFELNPISSCVDEREYMLGGIALSIDTIKNEANVQSKVLNHHIMHLLLHGFLHLLGYVHEKDGDASVMEDIEVRVLSEFGLKNPYG